MRGADYYLDDPRLVLVPSEHLTPAGMSAEFAALVTAERAWSPGHVGLFDAGFARYWERSAGLARRTRTWCAPRLRHVAVVRDPCSVRPYVQLLNTSAWLLYESDLDPDASHPELVAYLLALGDRMAVSGEVTTAAVQTAAWWLERTDEEQAAFAAAARRATRPDTAALRALAEALPWLRQLRHEALRPLVVLTPHRPIPGTGLLVPRALEAEPSKLVACWTGVARAALAAHRAACRGPDPGALTALCDWLVTETPPLLVTGARDQIVWDPEAPARLGTLHTALHDADGVAVHAVLEDLRVVTRHTRAFHVALVEPAALPAPAPNTDQSGYTYLHRTRRLIAYNLHETGMERLAGPPLPYARHMLGARTAHEWAHLADRAGWVPRAVPPAQFAERKLALAVLLEAAITAAPADVRHATRADLGALSPDSPGRALTRILLSRMPDYRANLVATRFMSDAERETYLRHNIRTLASPPAHWWRTVVRYLYEYQYLGPRLGSPRIADPRSWFLRSTGFDPDGVLGDSGFDGLAAAVAALCACYAVDETRFRFPSG